MRISSQKYFNRVGKKINKKWMVVNDLKLTIFYQVPGLHQPVCLQGLLFLQRT